MKFLKNCTVILFIIIQSGTLLYSEDGLLLRDKYLSDDENSGPGETVLSGRLYSDVLRTFSAGEFAEPGETRSYSPLADSDDSVDFGDGTGFPWEDGGSSFDWIISVGHDGLYNLSLEYFPLSGNGMTIQRKLLIDGKSPFIEAENIPFYRMWRDDGPVKVNTFGDEVRPGQVEVARWQKSRFTDINGLYPGPFSFYLTEGSHRITLQYVDQPMAIGDLTVSPAEILPTYDSYRDLYSFAEPVGIDAEVRVQGEDARLRSDSILRRENSFDPSVEPFSGGKSLLNIIGGWRWRSGNQSISWKIMIPQAGFYQMPIRLQAPFGEGLPVHRQILIDGEIPFEEFREYSFPFGLGWTTHIPGDSKGNPYLIYLDKGEHTIALVNKPGTQRDAVLILKDLSLRISELNKQIIMITGGNPDLNFDYELEKKIPGLLGEFTHIVVELERVKEILLAVSTSRSPIISSYTMKQEQLRDLLEKPYLIPRRLGDLIDVQMLLSDSPLWLQEQPLNIDYLSFVSPERHLKDYKAGLFRRIYVSFMNFFRSFYKEYDQVAGMEEEGDVEINTYINVWVARGKEWGEIMKQMADELFTPATGIGVNVNVVPMDSFAIGGSGGVNSLLLSLVSGKYPDVALGVPQEAPVEYAIRGAVTDLSQFSDFEEVMERFLPGTTMPLTYDNGVYAIPETMDFTVMFYRKDILNELNLRVPSTREDLFRKVLPVLAQNGMSFYYAMRPNDVNEIARLYTPLLYQGDGEYYSEDLMSSGLDSDMAYQAFREMTRFFTVYNCEIQADFYNRFRIGEMPIGISSFADYMKILVAAPELFGRWGIAPYPGVLQEDGSVDRTAGGKLSTAVIIDDSSKKDAAWEFIKWWTGADVQSLYGREIEAVIGTEARWNSANIEAFSRLPWPEEDKNVFEEQWQWYAEQPMALGGYFTNRHLRNAWSSVVMGDMDPRDALEKAVDDINTEMNNKQFEQNRRKEVLELKSH